MGQGRIMQKLSIVIAVAATLALGACETTSTSSIAPASGAATGSRSAEATAPVNSPQASLSRPAPIEPSYIPTSAELIGVDAARAETLLGAPALRRLDRDAELWQYPSDACVLFVFLYPNEAGDMAVDYLTSGAVHAGDSVPDDDACIAAAVRAAANAARLS